MMFDAFRKYADFSGRASRKEFWLYFLLQSIVLIVTYALDCVMGTLILKRSVGVFSGLAMLGLAIPYAAVLTRRLHDINRSGWWQLLAFFPYSLLIFSPFLCKDGTKGENRFGPDPKEEERGSEVGVA